MKAVYMHISRQSLILIGVSLVLVLAVVLFGILPERRSRDALGVRMAEIQAELDAREALRPMREALEREKAEAERLDKLELAGNACESRQRLPVQALVPTLTKLAGEAGLEDARVLPQPETLDAAALSMRVTAVLHGDLESLRRFLLSLAAAPFVQNVETLDIARPDQRLEFVLGLRLRLESARQDKSQTVRDSRSRQAHDQA